MTIYNYIHDLNEKDLAKFLANLYITKINDKSYKVFIKGEHEYEIINDYQHLLEFLNKEI